ncbi:hypothetical protein BKA61DRAFT_714228 [Leptodontidium sp. MPI-SDFR-AT-0119]|nr:hypothetical protein BKA61DRAFT_714228 [Leptodontidium sp. MPI-SDFR-AT-0119]
MGYEAFTAPGSDSIQQTPITCSTRAAARKLGSDFYARQSITLDHLTKLPQGAKHAVSAASAVSEILQHDPELSFMLYLFGVCLMHGSFILLVFADKMEMTTSETIGQACETIIDVHEVFVVTLNTEYQLKKLQKGGQIGFVYVDVLDFC